MVAYWKIQPPQNIASQGASGTGPIHIGHSVWILPIGQAPTNGASGDGAGWAAKGSLLVRYDTNQLYQNTNTKASPTWTAVATPNGGAVAITGGTVDGTPVGGTTPAAGNFTLLGLNVDPALTAVGTNRATSLALTKSINRVGTAASGTGVTLPAAATPWGQIVIMDNDGANPIKVYGAGSDTIDGTAGATGVTLTNAKRAIFISTAANTWFSLMGVPSA